MGQILGCELKHIATVGAALLIFVYEFVCYNAIFLGRVLPARDKNGLVLPFALLFNTIWVMAIWSYIQAHISNPGTMPPQWRKFVDEMGDCLPISPARLEWQPGKATWCKKCAIPRPERAHHCHLCGFC